MMTWTPIEEERIGALVKAIKRWGGADPVPQPVLDYVVHFPALLAELKLTPHDMECHPSEGTHSARCLRVRALIAVVENH